MTATISMKNPLTTEDRRHENASPWVRSFSCEDMGVLVVCRGPIRQETIDVLRELGVPRIGMLLSEKDSIVYEGALAPELRTMEPKHVHPVEDYSGATKAERVERIAEIIAIARAGDYGYIFAGYGFMAEDADFARAIEDAGLRFIGPCSNVHAAAGKKDEAKRTALDNGVSVTPGIGDLTRRTLLAAHPDRASLVALAEAHELDVPRLADEKVALTDLAEATLQAGYSAGLDLFSIDDLAAKAAECVGAMIADHEGSRIRLKAIGGGGGKGQRIVEDADAAPNALREILSEVKTTGAGDDKNVLVELNIEQTRHHEIQLVGNGTWCVALGGRDCSLQMHEQKLLEISLTQEAFGEAIADAERAGRTAEAKALSADLSTLTTMEAEAERFGKAVALDSASTFECIVDRGRHYFMEVNTRIQVEHRVSELCYALRFANPDDPSDYFDVGSLVEAMVRIARHGDQLPKPTRVRREQAAVEARLNATDRALSPHAGGTIIHWSAPIEGEIRDDQGISVKNPDTGLFKAYRLAGAYDSNVALLVTTGDDRLGSYDQLHEVLRRTRLRGTDLSTNLQFHYGLLNWFRTRNVWAKPTTRFVVPYLTLVGLLEEEANRLDVDVAWKQVCDRIGNDSGAAAPALAQVLATKKTLVLRPIRLLLEEPHLLSAWLSTHADDWVIEDGVVRWLQNPIEVLAETYALVDMDHQEDQPAAFVIWPKDDELLDTALGFYAHLRERLGTGDDYPALLQQLASATPPADIDAALWKRVQASHAGFSAGLEVLGLLPLIGEVADFYELRLNDDLTVHIPERLFDPALQKAMRKVLVPPPAAAADEIVSVSGGMYYAQEAPGRPPLVSVGEHFEAGQPLYVIEVMKMFNKVEATFSGTVDAILVDEDGKIVKKGQTLFKVTPDERPDVVDPAELAASRAARTAELISRTTR